MSRRQAGETAHRRGRAKVRIRRPRASVCVCVPVWRALRSELEEFAPSPNLAIDNARYRSTFVVSLLLVSDWLELL